MNRLNAAVTNGFITNEIPPRLGSGVHLTTTIKSTTLFSLNNKPCTIKFAIEHINYCVIIKC